MKVQVYLLLVSAMLAVSLAAPVEETEAVEPVAAPAAAAAAPETEAVPVGRRDKRGFLAATPLAYPYAAYPAAYTAAYTAYPAAYSAYTAYPTAYHTAAPLIAAPYKTVASPFAAYTYFG